MKLAVTWAMCGYIDIPNAKTTEEAMEIFEKESDYIKLPQNGEYVDGSFELSTYDIDEMKIMCSMN